MSRKGQTITGTEKATGQAAKLATSYQRSARPKKVQPPTSEEEKEQRKATGRTMGRKGCYKDRINMAFTVDNYEFVKRFSRCKGMNMTDFVNYIIDEYREANKADFEKIEAFINKKL